MAVTTLEISHKPSSPVHPQNFKIMNYLQTSQFEVNIFVWPTSNLFPLSIIVETQARSFLGLSSKYYDVLVLYH